MNRENATGFPEDNALRRCAHGHSMDGLTAAPGLCTCGAKLPNGREVFKGLEIENTAPFEFWGEWAAFEPGGNEALYVGELRSDVTRWITNRRTK